MTFKGHENNWFSENIDIIVLVFGISLLIASFPVGDYFVKLNSSIDLTGHIYGDFWSSNNSCGHSILDYNEFSSNDEYVPKYNDA